MTEFSHSLRCDSCPQEAQVIINLDLGEDVASELVFCGHHGRKTLESLSNSSTGISSVRMSDGFSQFHLRGTETPLEPAL